MDIVKNVYGNYAEKYFEKGYCPIPTRCYYDKEKNKYIKPPAYGANEISLIEVSEHGISKTKIDKWIFEHSDSGIGIVLGKSSNLVCLDIDNDNEEFIKRMPFSPCTKFGSKGQSRFFQYMGEKNINFKDGVIDVDLLSDGRYTVIPPSSMGNDRSYIWTGQEELLSVGELPFLPAETYQYLLSLKKTIGGDNISDGGRNDTLKKIVYSMLYNGSDPTAIINDIIIRDEELFSCHPEGPLFLDSSEIKNASSVWGRAAFFVSSNIVSSYRGGKAPPDPFIVRINDSTDTTLKKIEKSQIDYKMNSLPPFRGVAQKIFEYIYSNSPVKRTRFSVAATLSTMSTLLSNEFSCCGIHPNLYTVIIGDSGSGKDWPTHAPHDIFLQTKCNKLIGGSPESDSGILWNLKDRVSRLDCYDEAGTLFLTMNDTKNSWSAKMANVYATLYTSPGKMFLGKTLKDKEIGKCFSPCINLICGLTFNDFKKHFTTELVIKGLGARFLYFADSEEKELNDLEDKIPLNLEILSFCEKIRACEAVNALEFGNKEFVLPIDKTCLKAFKNIGNKYRAKADCDDAFGALLNRAGEIVMKLAIIDTVSLGRREMILDSLSWAADWYSSYITSCKVLMANNLFSSINDMASTEIENLIMAQGPAGMSKSNLLLSYLVKKKLCLQAKGLDIQLNDLIQSEKIECKNVKTKTRTGKIYIHTKHFTQQIYSN